MLLVGLQAGLLIQTLVKPPEAPMTTPAQTVAPPAPTEKFCSVPLGIMDQEQHYLSALQTAATYNLAGGLLTLSDGAGNQVAVFVPAR